MRPGISWLLFRHYFHQLLPSLGPSDLAHTSIKLVVAINRIVTILCC